MLRESVCCKYTTPMDLIVGCHCRWWAWATQQLAGVGTHSGPSTVKEATNESHQHIQWVASGMASMTALCQLDHMFLRSKGARDRWRNRCR